MPYLPKWIWSKRGMALGSCQSIYHSMCLISIFLVCRLCVLCCFPFHRCLYELFGLTRYMPPSWEKDPINTLEESMTIYWNEDLIWNWHKEIHSVYKMNVRIWVGEEIQKDCLGLQCIGWKKAPRLRKENFFLPNLEWLLRLNQ